ncbi:unnamed protein product [Cuscuta europaea]|uniref:Uncharacterized protein n=1 Tax=Cuscuta europaea TaxID=41803 RepID=A0A9P0YGN8_CUSEU|nr:unnamed protein product [Cuscuta europaea]
MVIAPSSTQLSARSVCIVSLPPGVSWSKILTRQFVILKQHIMILEYYYSPEK